MLKLNNTFALPVLCVPDIQIQHLLKLNLNVIDYLKHKNYSNTTLVKVKSSLNFSLSSVPTIQIQHLLKLNYNLSSTFPSLEVKIQIQHLLKLNYQLLSIFLLHGYYSNTTLVKVK